MAGRQKEINVEVARSNLVQGESPGTKYKIYYWQQQESELVVEPSQPRPDLMISPVPHYQIIIIEFKMCGEGQERGGGRISM